MFASWKLIPVLFIFLPIRIHQKQQTVSILMTNYPKAFALCTPTVLALSHRLSLTLVSLSEPIFAVVVEI